MWFAGVYTFDFGDRGALQFSADTSYRDAMQLSVENTAALGEEGYWLLGGFVSRISPAETWTVTAGIKNATDEVYNVEGQGFRSVAYIQTAYYGDLRTWTLSAEYRY